MIKCEVIKDFTLGEFDKLKNIKKANINLNEKNKLYVNDTFECDERMARYLTGDNSKNEVVVRIIEVSF